MEISWYLGTTYHILLDSDDRYGFQLYTRPDGQGAQKHTHSHTNTQALDHE